MTRIKRWCIGLAALACGACDEPVRPRPGAMIASIALSPLAVRLLPGDSMQLTLAALDSAGASVPPVAISWTSRDADLVSVTRTGLVRATALSGTALEDTTWIVAAAEELRDSVRVVVATGSVRIGSSTMGINLAMLTDWSTEWPFVDLMRAARFWISQRNGGAWGTGDPLVLTPDYQVRSLPEAQYATTIVLTDVTAHQPPGDYTLLYDGDGDIDISNGPTGTMISREPGRIVVRVQPSQGAVFINLRRTSASNPVRNIRFLREGTEGSYRVRPYAESFLRVVRPFGALRFMDWQRTNENDAIEWTGRATTSFSTFAGPWGAPVELMVVLANETGADPWFCMPHRASDDYVREFALLVRAQLGPRQKVYVEYTNEAWNSIFPQATYARERGQVLNLSSDVNQAALRFYSQRAVEMFAIWRQVFGADSARVVRVLASQAANSWTAEQVLSWRDAFRHADALAIAPYFGGSVGQGDGTTQAAMSETQVLDALESEIEGPIRDFIEANARVARTYGTQLIAYEGGQHLVSAFVAPANEPAVTRLFTSVNRNPRMGDLYRRYFEIWRAAGGGLFLPYHDADAWSRYGSWGALEYIHQDPATSPKYQAILAGAATPAAANH